MAKKSMKVKASREPKFEVRKYTRCNRCGRPHAVLKKYGICKELDIHMFNLLTYSFLNELDYYKTRYNILVNGIKFQDKESIKICNSLFLDNKYPNKDFLIDTIDETSFQM